MIEYSKCFFHSVADETSTYKIHLPASKLSPTSSYMETHNTILSNIYISNV